MKQPMQTKPHWLQATVPAMAILALLVFMGCSKTHQAAGKRLNTEDFTLTYTDKAQAGSKIAELTLQHPLNITERQMLIHLVALRYENYSLLSKVRPVFTKEDIQKTKRLLTKALNKAHAQNIIGFEVETESGTTKGELFASNRNLHWRFSEIRGVKYSLTGGNVARNSIAWRMVPRKGQKFHVTEKLLGTKKWTNWIEAKIDLPTPANLKTARPENQRAQSGGGASEPPLAPMIPPKTATPQKNPADLEEKLKFLKHLYDKQLIDQQEYEKKRKDLLDQYL
jgi:hypothetical protein